MRASFFSNVLVLAALTGAIGVGLGAFGAHVLKSQLDPVQMETLRTAMLYLFVHVLATLAVVHLGFQRPQDRRLKLAGIFFMAGIWLFSGSLVWIATSSLTGLPTRFIGPITPLGGIAFMAGWIALALFGMRLRQP